MTRKLPIPRKSIYRFSLYLRCLQGLARDNVSTVSSERLAKAAKVSPSQLRKDLAYLGTPGRRGFGYYVTELKGRIDSLMGTNLLTPIVLVGAGNLGAALLSYQGFQEVGFEIAGAFDLAWKDHPAPRDSDITIQPMEKLAEFIATRKISIAILAVPAEAAQTVANRLAADGIRGILNFSPVLLELPNGVLAHNVNVALELQNLAYFIRK
ncbi:MAG TPA: redox-sensing transcriptional repressor Rex [Chthoniobacteraceae bacterium]|nr:redox-sensing transcriptional repressor Rex [Chthoniobacteraceae bacterium]